MAEDLIENLIDRKLITEDVNFFAKSVEATVNIAKEGAKEHSKIAEQIRLWRESVNQISTSTNQAEFNKQFQQTTQYGNQAKQAVKEFNEIIKQEQAELQKGLSVLKQYGGSLEANVKQNLDLKKQLKEVQAELKLQQKAAELTAGSSDDFSIKIQELAQQEAILKQQIQQSNLAVRQRSKEMISAEGSVDELDAKLNQLRSTYSQLNEEERNGDNGNALLQSITQLDTKVKALKESQGNFRDSVGNYAGKLAGSFDILKQRLEQIKKLLADNANSNNLSAESTAKLQQEQSLLEIVIGKNADGFNNLQQAIKAQTTTLQLMAEQGLKGTEAYNQLFDATAKLKDEFQDLKDELKFSSDNQSSVDKFANSLKQLAAIYQVAEGAAALFGVESEEIQRSTQRLMAVQNIANGIYQLQEEVKRKGSIVNSLYNLIMYGQVTATNAATEATIIHSTATTTATTATNGLIIAQRVLRAALIATGIGALIVAIGYLVEKIAEWTSSTEIANKNQKLLNESISTQIELYQKLYNFQSFAAQKRIEQSESELNIAKAKGLTQAEILAREITLEKQRYDLAHKNIIDKFGNENNFNTAFAKSSSHRIDIIGKEEKLNAEITQRIYYLKNKGVKAEDDDILKQLNLKKEVLDSELKNAENSFNILEGMYNDSNNAVRNIKEKEAQASKLKADELRQYTLESAKLTSERVIAENERVLNNDLSTLKQRIDAIKSTAAEQKKIAEAENKAVQADPTISPQKKAIAERKLSNELNKISADAKKKEFDITQDWNNRIAKAEQDKFKTLKDQQNNFYNSIIEDERLNIQQRLIAANQLNQNLVEIENNAYENELRLLKQKAVDKKEIEALEVAHNGRLSQIKLDASNKINSIILSDKDYQKKLADEGYADLLNTYAEQENAATRAYNNEVIALNAQFTNKKISKKQYDKQLEDLEYQHQIKILNIQLESARKSVNNFGDTEKAYNEALDTRKVAYEQYSNATTAQEKADAKAYLDQAEKEVEVTKEANDKKIKATQDLSNAQKALSDATTKHTNDNEEKKKQKLLQTLDYVKQVIDAVGGALQSIVDGNIDAQKNAIQEQIDLVDKQKEAAIASANAEAISQEEKAAKIAIINANAQAKKEALDRRQKELDNKKAKADRDFQIFNIIGNTAIAVTKFLSTGNLTQAIIAGIIGAAQLTSVLATPIPKYAKGIDSTPHDSLAWVGDGGKKEVGVTPQGDVFVTPEKPTLTYLQKGTRIYPSIQDYQMRVSDLALHNSLENGSKSIDKLQIEMAYSKVMEQQLIQTNSKLDSLENAIKNIPGVTINNTWENTQTRIKRATGYTTYFNDFIKT